MKYELWDVASAGNEEPLHPLTKLFESEDFMTVFVEFEKQYEIGEVCVMIANKEPISDTYKTDEKIYESPDGGKTIFERTILNLERKQIK
jgi:hypothetical protein